MAESYPNADENRAPDSVRGVARPFADFGYGDFLRAFDAVVGAKPERSEGETALIRRAEKFCRVLVKFPGIRRIWVCNSLSMNAADGDSDIDLFVETAPGMLWTGRVMATLFFSLLGVRRHGNHVKGRFCLSFFAVENADLGKVAVDDDAYLYEWARRLVSVDGKDFRERLPKNSPVQENNPQDGTGSSHENVLDRRESDDSNEMLAPVCGLFSSADDRRFRPRMR